MKDSMMHQKYTSQIGEKYAILDKNYHFQKLNSVNVNKSPKADSNSRSAVHKHDILTNWDMMIFNQIDIIVQTI